MAVTGNRPPMASGNDRFDAGDGEFAAFPRSPAEALEPVRPPTPPEYDDDRRMHPVLAFFNAMFALAFFSAVVLLAVYFFMRYQFDRPGPLPTSTVIVIPKGSGVDGIADRLKHDDVIADRGLFKATVIFF